MVDRMSAAEYRKAAAKPKRRKYGEVPVVIDGIPFASTIEGNRYLELREMQRRGDIRGLTCQPKFELQPAFADNEGKRVRAITYRADFRYTKLGSGHLVIEDVKSKGTMTQAWKLRWKMLQHKVSSNRDVRLVIFE